MNGTTCLDCVERVEVKVWVPKAAYEFFTGILEWDDDMFVLELLLALSSVIDSQFCRWNKATEVRRLIDRITEEMYSFSSA